MVPIIDGHNDVLLRLFERQELNGNIPAIARLQLQARLGRELGDGFVFHTRNALGRRGCELCKRRDASGLQLQHLRERHAGDKENAVSRTPFLFATAAILAEPAGFAGDGASVVIFGLSEAFELAH